MDLNRASRNHILLQSRRFSPYFCCWQASGLIPPETGLGPFSSYLDGETRRGDAVVRKRTRIRESEQPDGLGRSGCAEAIALLVIHLSGLGEIGFFGWEIANEFVQRIVHGGLLWRISNGFAM
jgi:hypothetical protein